LFLSTVAFGIVIVVEKEGHFRAPGKISGGRNSTATKRAINPPVVH
jgi:hypothetical protein